MSEDKISLSAEQIELIEELAHTNEMVGLQPAMAKVHALLMVNDEVELTFDQIKETLELSKGAVSQALNQLLMTKKISYKTKLGDRKRYFHARLSDWDSQLMESFASVSSLAKIYKKVLDQRPEKTKDFNEGLAEMVDFLSFLQHRLVGLYQEFKNSK